MVLASAIKFYEADNDYPIIICGERHADIYEKIHNLHLKPVNKDEGFLTSDNRFVDRYEAAQIAYANGQIKEPLVMLYSEDVW